MSPEQLLLTGQDARHQPQAGNDDGCGYIRAHGCDPAAASAAQSSAAEIPIAASRACCFLVTACSVMRDHERASECCDRSAERYRSRYMLAFCRAEYGAVHVWYGSWLEAE